MPKATSRRQPEPTPTNWDKPYKPDRDFFGRPTPQAKRYPIEDSRHNDAVIKQAHTAAVFKRLVNNPDYVYLKELGVALTKVDAIPAPQNMDDAIRFHYWTMRKATLDAFFDAVESQAKLADVFAKQATKQTSKVKTRKSIFSAEEGFETI